MDTHQIVTATLTTLVLVAGMDLGIAALIRATRESGRESHD